MIDFTVTLLSLEYQEPLGNAHTEKHGYLETRLARTTELVHGTRSVLRPTSLPLPTPKFARRTGQFGWCCRTKGSLFGET